jgi:hypothetical protein
MKIFSWSLNVLCRGLRKLTVYDGYKQKIGVKNPLVWIGIRIGSGFSNGLDLDLDPGSWIETLLVRIQRKTT